MICNHCERIVTASILHKLLYNHVWASFHVWFECFGLENYFWCVYNKLVLYISVVLWFDLFFPWTFNRRKSNTRAKIASIFYLFTWLIDHIGNLSWIALFKSNFKIKIPSKDKSMHIKETCLKSFCYF